MNDNETDIFSFNYSNTNLSNLRFTDKSKALQYIDEIPEETLSKPLFNDIAPKFDIPKTYNIIKVVTVYDVAAYIISKLGPLSALKLQKLVYYCQAWSLVWDESPLYPERIEAWKNGPVIPALYSFHRGQFTVGEISLGNIDNLNSTQKETIDAVIDYYGTKPAQWLIDLSHSEKPWKETRNGLSENEPSNREIKIDLIAEYYSSLKP